MATNKTDRRAYKYGYNDVGGIVGKTGASCRKWMTRRGLRLDSEEPKKSLVVVAYYIQKMKHDGDAIMLIPNARTVKIVAKKPEVRDYTSAKLSENIKSVQLSITGDEQKVLPNGNNRLMQAVLDGLAEKQEPAHQAESRDAGLQAKDPMEEIKVKKDRYNELYMEGGASSHGDYSDYTKDEIEEMYELKTWLNEMGVRV